MKNQNLRNTTQVNSYCSSKVERLSGDSDENPVYEDFIIANPISLDIKPKQTPPASNEN